MADELTHEFRTGVSAGLDAILNSVKATTPFEEQVLSRIAGMSVVIESLGVSVVAEEFLVSEEPSMADVLDVLADSVTDLKAIIRRAERIREDSCD